MPKSHVYRIVRSGEIRVNPKREEVFYRLQIGDILRIPPIRVAQRKEAIVAGAAINADLPILYEDEPC